MVELNHKYLCYTFSTSPNLLNMLVRNVWCGVFVVKGKGADEFAECDGSSDVCSPDRANMSLGVNNGLCKICVHIMADFRIFFLVFWYSFHKDFLTDQVRVT